MKLGVSLLLSLSSVALGGYLFMSSYKQTYSRQTVTPYSSRVVMVATDMAEPWKTLLRFGGAAIALGGGTYFGSKSVDEIQAKMEGFLKVENQQSQQNFTTAISSPVSPQPPTPPSDTRKPRFVDEFPDEWADEELDPDIASLLPAPRGIPAKPVEKISARKMQVSQTSSLPANFVYEYDDFDSNRESVEKNLNVIPLRQILRANRLSWVLCGPSRVGKTTSLMTWIYDVITATPKAKFFINGWKNDSWIGLAKVPGVFARNTPNLETGEVDFSGFFRQVQVVTDILNERLNLPESERQDLSPVWLVLDDFFATSDYLNKAKEENARKWEIAKSQFSQIILLGGEYRVGLCGGTHSFNLKSLGVEDSNIRGCLGICAFGKIYLDEEGRREGGYDMINTALKNSYLVSSENANDLRAIFPQLKIESEKTGCAIALTTFGEPQIGLITEDLSFIKTTQILARKTEISREGKILPFPSDKEAKENLAN